MKEFYFFTFSANEISFVSVAIFPALPVVPVHRDSPGQNWCMWGWKGAAPAWRGVR